MNSDTISFIVISALILLFAMLGCIISNKKNEDRQPQENEEQTQEEIDIENQEQPGEIYEIHIENEHIIEKV